MDLVSDQTVFPRLKIRFVDAVPSVQHVVILGGAPVLLAAAAARPVRVGVLEHLSDVHLLLLRRRLLLLLLLLDDKK